MTLTLIVIIADSFAVILVIFQVIVCLLLLKTGPDIKSKLLLYHTVSTYTNPSGRSSTTSILSLYTTSASL